MLLSPAPAQVLDDFAHYQTLALPWHFLLFRRSEVTALYCVKVIRNTNAWNKVVPSSSTTHPELTISV